VAGGAPEADDLLQGVIRPFTGVGWTGVGVGWGGVGWGGVGWGGGGVGEQGGSEVSGEGGGAAERGEDAISGWGFRFGGFGQTLDGQSNQRAVSKTGTLWV
jgi:hypothetical protein